jgi:hypothetical protein
MWKHSVAKLATAFFGDIIQMISIFQHYFDNSCQFNSVKSDIRTASDMFPLPASNSTMAHLLFL